MAELTDEQALAALNKTVTGRAQVADLMATRTIIYPVEIVRKAGAPPSIEIRPYVIMGQYYPERKWEKALDVEKRYSGLNKQYKQDLIKKGLPTDRKAEANPLNTEPLDFK